MSNTPRFDALNATVQNQNWGFRDMQILAGQLERELNEWKLAAWKLGIYQAGTDVSTPAKWITAQLNACERMKIPPFTNAMTACSDCDPCLGGRPDQCVMK